jgi:hypothetical protein
MEPNEEKAEVILALQKYLNQFDEIISLFEENNSMSPDKKENARNLLRTLKSDLKTSSRYGTVSGNNTELNCYERKYFMPAVTRACANLNARVNSDPIKGKWLDFLMNAQSDISIWSIRLEEHNE